VYGSKDPLYFAIEDDAGLVATLPIAAPEIFEHEGRHYVAALMPDLDGIRIAPLAWTNAPMCPSFELGDLPLAMGRVDSIAVRASKSDLAAHFSITHRTVGNSGRGDRN
jgi:hypothetical protein